MLLLSNPQLSKISLALAILALSPANASAKRSCWNSDKTFYDCSAGSEGALGVSAPVIGDTLDTNPANLPTESSPFGIEAIYSDRTSPHGKPGLGFSTVKGFDGLGFGVGAWSKGTFNAPDFAPHFIGVEPEKYRAFELKEKKIPGIRLGTTVVLPSLFLPSFIRLSIGGSVGFGQVSGKPSTQVGAVVRLWRLGVGYSENYERLSEQLPSNRISVFSAGIFLGPVYANYAHTVMRSSLNRTFTNSVALRIPFRSGWPTAAGSSKKTTAALPTTGTAAASSANWASDLPLATNTATTAIRIRPCCRFFSKR
jgi:hypothetical protein